MKRFFVLATFVFGLSAFPINNQTFAQADDQEDYFGISAPNNNVNIIGGTGMNVTLTWYQPLPPPAPGNAWKVQVKMIRNSDNAQGYDSGLVAVGANGAPIPPSTTPQPPPDTVMNFN